MLAMKPRGTASLWSNRPRVAWSLIALARAPFSHKHLLIIIKSVEKHPDIQMGMGLWR